MSVLFQVNQICKNHGARVILEDATASFSRHQKIGMIGRNGTGKSTLCRIITGHEEADSGQISKNSALKLSYLEQHDPYKPEETVIDFLVRYTGKEEWECGEMAGRFQLKHDILYAPISQLAGGFRTRVKLTAMLLPDPNFLILDEPTNYLDLSTLLLLENFLRDFQGGFLIVSHDREFLKKTCKHTLEVENGKLNFYPGPIEDYFEFKEQQREQIAAYNKTIESKKRQLQEFVDRFKARAATATRAKSKMRQIEKLKTIEVEHVLGSVQMKLPPVEKRDGVALFCQDLTIGYPDREVAKNITFEIDRGSHVAVLGDNGQGKTTFLRTIANDLKTAGGSFRWNAGLKIAYYAQHVFATLNPQDDVYGYLSRYAAPGVLHQDILDMAGSFFFKGDDVRKKVSVLSGGERARLCLAGLLLSKSQVLLLDEPTNHLDFETVEALASALKEFAGTVFFISHDRTFVNMLATNIIEVKAGKVSRYPGTYEEYVYHLQRKMEDELRQEGYMVAPPERKPKAKAPQAGQDAKALRQQTEAEIKQLEKKVMALREEKEKMVQEFSQPGQTYSREKQERLSQIEEDLEAAEEEWLELEERLEELKEN